MPQPLILAINPGNAHSPTLARLARELKGCEIIGADSCVIAISAINARVPDLVLLPERSPRGEPELLARLRAVRGGVPTMKLPPVSAADPVALAKEIRNVLAAGGAKTTATPTPAARTAPARATTVSPVPTGPSPQVVAAAKAAVKWMQLRRVMWEATASDLARELAFAPPSTVIPTGQAPESYESFEANEPDEPSERYEPHEPEERHEPDEPHEPFESVESSSSSRKAGVSARWRRMALRWLPRIGVLGALIAVAAGVAAFWPRFQGTATDAVATVDKPRDLTPQTTIAVTSNVPAEVLIDGTRAGETPFTGRMLLGTRTVTVRAAGAERQFSIEATMKPVQLNVNFSEP